MAEKGITQKVAAILAADAVGYSRLMADDEPATMDALDAARASGRRRLRLAHWQRSGVSLTSTSWDMVTTRR